MSVLALAQNECSIGTNVYPRRQAINDAAAMFVCLELNEAVYWEISIASFCTSHTKLLLPRRQHHILMADRDQASTKHSANPS
jgi:hypothetical protein